MKVDEDFILVNNGKLALSLPFTDGKVVRILSAFPNHLILGLTKDEYEALSAAHPALQKPEKALATYGKRTAGILRD